MFAEFRALALEDEEASYHYGSECLFRFFSYGLEKKWRPQLWKEFQELTLADCAKGRLYGLEKLWAFLHYSKEKPAVRPELQALLAQYRTLDDFEAARSAAKAREAAEAANNLF
jgi:la-related protein 1